MIKKILKITLVILVLFFIAIQFVRPDFTNPTVIESEKIAAADVPPDVEQILRRSCADCHSNETVYPWYSKVTPFNWFLADHIQVGRSELNFSEWNTYTTEKKIRKLDDICEQVESGAMPLPSYLWIHRDAVLSETEALRLCEWARGESQKLSE